VTDIEFLEVTNPSFYSASDAPNVQGLKGRDVAEPVLVSAPGYDE
jgi:hypothetical protein